MEETKEIKVTLEIEGKDRERHFKQIVSSNGSCWSDFVEIVENDFPGSKLISANLRIKPKERKKDKKDE